MRRASIIAVVLGFFSSFAIADGLKVFGKEFCYPNDAGVCINFHHETLKDARTWRGEFKYPKGRAAYDQCVRDSDKSDGSFAFCSMVFHREEQSMKKRQEMCSKAVREEYRRVTQNAYAVGLYDVVWNCR